MRPAPWQEVAPVLHLVRSSPGFRAERRRAREVGFAAAETYARAAAAGPPTPNPPLAFVDAEARHLRAVFVQIQHDFLQRTARDRGEKARLEARLRQAEADAACGARAEAAAGEARTREAARRAALEDAPLAAAGEAAGEPVAVGRWTITREWAVGAMVFFALADCYFGFLSFQVLVPGLPALLGGLVFAAVCAWLAEVVGQRAALHGWRHADVRLALGALGVLITGAAVLRAVYAAAGATARLLLFAGFVVVLGGIAVAIFELAIHTETPDQHDRRRLQRLEARIGHRRASAVAACVHHHHLYAVLLVEWRGGFQAACLHHRLPVPPEVAAAERRLPEPPGADSFAAAPQDGPNVAQVGWASP